MKMRRRNRKWGVLIAAAVCLLLYIVWRGAHAIRQEALAPSETGVQVPVLMYHAIGDAYWGEEHLFVKPAELEKQLQYLYSSGYETIFFEDLAHIDQYEKPIILTFDDGYDDNYTVLLPLLQKYNMKATIFMIGRDIGAPHKLTKAQLRELAQSGLVSVQSHGWSHREMAGMTWPELLRELIFSRYAIAAATGQIPYAIAYPNGKSAARTCTAAGLFYAYGAGTFEEVYVTGMNPMCIDRFAIRRDTTMDVFEAICRTAGYRQAQGSGQTAGARE